MEPSGRNRGRSHARKEPAMTSIDRSQPSYFSKYRNIRFERSEDGILVMSLHNDGRPLTFTAQDHESFVDAFYDVARDRGNKVVILTGAGEIGRAHVLTPVT